MLINLPIVFMVFYFRAQFRIEISKLKIKSDLLTLKNTHHKGRYLFINIWK